MKNIYDRSGRLKSHIVIKRKVRNQHGKAFYFYDVVETSVNITCSNKQDATSHANAMIRLKKIVDKAEKVKQNYINKSLKRKR